MSPEILLFIIKIVIGGLVSFLAILTMSRTRNPEWMLLMTGFLLNYAATVYELLTRLGILSRPGLNLRGIPLVDLLMAAVPGAFFMAAFIVKAVKK